MERMRMKLREILGMKVDMLLVSARTSSKAVHIFDGQ